MQYSLNYVVNSAAGRYFSVLFAFLYKSEDRDGMKKKETRPEWMDADCYGDDL